MSRLFKLLIISMFVLILSACSLGESSNSEEQNSVTSLEEERYKEYENYTDYFNKVTSDELNTYENEGKTFFLYTGRKTCPHCQIFVPKLYYSYLSVRKNIDSEISIFYLDSENPNDKNLDAYQEKNNIKYVPNFSYFRDGKLIETLETYDDMSIDEITDFMASFY